MHFSLSDMMLDLFQNSVEANADFIELTLDQKKDSLGFRLVDNGRGMNPEELERAKDPFYSNGEKHKKRRIGMGIPFLLQTVDMTGGSCHILSEKGKGTTLDVVFNTNNIDTPPLGDLTQLFFQAFCSDGDFELKINRIKDMDKERTDYCLSRRELEEVLGNLNDAESMILLRQYIASQEN